MGLLEKYNTAADDKTVKAREQASGEQSVDFFDKLHQFQKLTKNFDMGTSFTPDALNYYDNRLANIIIPPSFVPIDAGINLNRWTSSNKYSDPESNT